MTKNQDSQNQFSWLTPSVKQEQLFSYNLNNYQQGENDQQDSMLSQQYSSSENLYSSKMKRINQETKNKVIQLFRGKQGPMDNKMVAVLLCLSVKKVQLLRKEYETTGNIIVTTKNRHSKYFQKRLQAQYTIMKKFIKENQGSILKDVQTKLKQSGFYLSITNICQKMNKIGYYFNPYPSKVSISNTVDILDLRARFAKWASSVQNCQIYFIGEIQINIAQELSFGWHRKLLIQKLKQKIKDKGTFLINITLGEKGLIGSIVSKKNSVRNNPYISNIIQNFCQVHNQNDYLVMDLPQRNQNMQKLLEFINQNPKIGKHLIDLPNNSHFLNPVNRILDQFKNNLVKSLNKRPLQKLLEHPQKQLQKIGQQIQQFFDEDFDNMQTVSHFQIFRRNMLKCIEKQSF